MSLRQHQFQTYTHVFNFNSIDILIITGINEEVKLSTIIKRETVLVPDT
jgi:hypothetical protein